MKYRVIGWTDYDNDLFEDGEISFAVLYTIADDIRKNGYVFSGFDHQERLYGAPVLNDGKRRAFSQRSFGAVMAEAYKLEGDYAYSLYAFEVNPEKLKMPTLAAEVGFKPEGDLSENFPISLSLDGYKETLTKGVIVIEDIDRLRFIDKGDRVLINAGDTIYTHDVVCVERSRLDGKAMIKIEIKL